jgi:PmbA protein
VIEESGLNVRVVKGGKVGVAGTTAMDAPPADVVTRALASAALGEPLEIEFPSSRAFPNVPTESPRAASASTTALADLGRILVERLSRPDAQINVTVEREVAETTIGNTAGGGGTYRATGVSVSADIARVAENDVLMVYDQFLGIGLPEPGDLDALVQSIRTRLELALTVVPSSGGSLPVVFSPMGLSAILLPLEEALSGKTLVQGISPLQGRIGASVFGAALSITDDPTLAGRPASYPFDDEGVSAGRLPLIERGVPKNFVHDLETAARLGGGARSTGHGHRGVFGKPRLHYSNFMVGSAPTGPTPWSFGGGLLNGISDGLLVDDLIGVGQGNVIGGAFSHPVALAYRIQNGKITGRVKDAAVAGNVYDLLTKIGGWGDDGRWVGTRWSPSLLLEGVSVAGR